MRDNTNSQASSLDTATWLRRADKFVKDKNYEAALDAIASARQLDPVNAYALAYEERVRALMHAGKSGSPSQPSKKEPREEDARASPPPLEQISHLAMQQAQSTAAASALQRREISVRKREEEERKRQEESRKVAIHTKVTAFVTRAEKCLAQKDFDRALGEISRALLLDPKNSQALSLDKKARATRDEAIANLERERTHQREEEERRRLEELQAERERIGQEQQERKNREDEARRQAQKQKIDQYLQRSTAHLASGRLQEAQNELAFVVVIDPLNPQVLSLQQQIRDAQESQLQAEMELRRKKEDEEKKKQQATLEAIQKHIENATKLAGLGNFDEALRVVTLAYVLDPMNEQIQSCENTIIAAHDVALQQKEATRSEEQERQRRQAEEERQQRLLAARQQILKGREAEDAALTRENEEKCKAHLAKAKEHLARQQFEGALAEVALAFMIDPFSNDVKEMEQVIRTAQSDHMQKHSDPLPESPPADSTATAQQIAEHVAAANQLREQHEYARALEELAKAFILDPLDPSIQKCEEAIQTSLTEGQNRDRDMNQNEQPQGTAGVQDRISRAQQFIARQSYDDALSEIALGLTLMPENGTLHELESAVWELKSHTGAEAGGVQPAADDAERIAQDDPVRVHLHAAEVHLLKSDFPRALDELAKVFAIDPLNAEASQLEGRIRQMQSIPGVHPES